MNVRNDIPRYTCDDRQDIGTTTEIDILCNHEVASQYDISPVIEIVAHDITENNTTIFRTIYRYRGYGAVDID